MQLQSYQLHFFCNLKLLFDGLICHIVDLGSLVSRGIIGNARNLSPKPMAIRQALKYRQVHFESDSIEIVKLANGKPREFHLYGSIF